MISLILTITLVGVLVYFVTTYLPMPAPFKQAIIVLAVLFLIFYLVQIFGLDIPLRRLR